jgi:hypothetical protein
VFLDVDGTFVNDRGVVPPSARKAVVAARANGHEVFLCTGRSMAELWGEIVEPGFDGVIASAVLGISLRVPAPHHSDGVPEAASRGTASKGESVAGRPTYDQQTTVSLRYDPTVADELLRE